jgi:uncharacterized protein (TIGR02246 family)
MHAMKTTHRICIIIVCSVSCLLTNTSLADQTEDEKSIREHASAYVAAYNKHDAKAVAGFWWPDAVYMDPSTGDAAVGREEIEKAFAGILADLGKAKLEVEVDSVEFVSPNVAIENGVARVIEPEGEPTETRYTAVNVKRDGKWLLDRVSEEEPPAPPPSNYEHLQELEWMVGSWIDQDEHATIQTDCQWTRNQNFMNRSKAFTLRGAPDGAPDPTITGLSTGRAPDGIE